MTDGHGRTNTVGHRAVRGQRMPPDVCLQCVACPLDVCVCVAPRRAFSFVQACLEDPATATERTEKSPPTLAVRFRSAKPFTRRVSMLADSPDLCAVLCCGLWWRCPPLLFSLFLSLSLSLTRHPLPSPYLPLLRSTPHATQHKPHRRRETRHMSGTTFEATNPDGGHRTPCATCRPSRSTFVEARHTSARSNMAAYRSVANR
ncbi:hypothetical protein ALC57_11472 [Trachymyrmex cornetzi]|uniref:Uncharacterized protein n=1 Tax=Trachymyrmex cornetzi TaxID=471704 RepID=A0A195DTS1_9HYME|nr:hypothetical protein ALC57_11472 [Trachymyrmex cornetzi]